MNTNKLVAALVAALSVGSSFAAGTTTTYAVGNQIYVAGSTALNSVSTPALATAATNLGYTLVASDSGSTGALTTPAKIGLWRKVVTATNGSKISVTTNVISLHLLGSEGGTCITASKSQGDFLPLDIAAGTKVAGDAAGAGGQGYVGSTNCTIKANATITFSDVDQAVGRFNTAKTAPVKCVALTKVGDLAAINFAIVAPSNFPANNITDRQLQAIAKNGHAPLSLFTGNPADNTNGVFLTGRDIDSGTRVLTLTEAGIGGISDVKQYVYLKSNNTLSLSIAGSVNGVSYTAGNGGHFSGGDLCQAIRDSVTNSWNGQMGAGSTNPYTGNSYIIGYTSSADLISKSGGFIKALAYNGVQPYTSGGTYGFQSNNSVIASGNYSLWSVGKLYKNTANAPKGTDKTVIDALASALFTDIASKTASQLSSGTAGYLPLGDLNVTRASEGAAIFSK
jgi:hypothetical protein